MALSSEQKQQVIEEFATASGDTGSTEVQIALLTAKIEALSQHLQENKKDHHGRRGLLVMVGRRRRLLKYLEREDFDRYKALISRLGLRR